jgi:hypothetical protein
MRKARETFLMFLKDNLDSSIGNNLHAVRFDINNPNTSLIQNNAVNITFSDPVFHNKVADQPVHIDVCHEDELTALDWCRAIWDLMSIRMYTELKDYTNPASPTFPGGVIFWRDTIRFRSVDSPFYSHLHARLSLYHTLK